MVSLSSRCGPCEQDLVLERGVRLSGRGGGGDGDRDSGDGGGGDEVMELCGCI